MKSLCVVALSIASFAFADAETNLLKPTNKAESWRFEQFEGGKGSLKADGDAMVFTITDVDGTNWHVQALQTAQEFQKQEFVFKAENVAANKNRINLTFGDAKGTVTVKDMTLTAK
jgi:hypothetical protein